MPVLILTALGFRLLGYLVLDAHRVVPLTERLEHPRADEGAPDVSAIEAVIARLRRKTGPGVIGIRRVSCFNSGRPPAVARLPRALSRGHSGRGNVSGQGHIGCLALSFGQLQLDPAVLGAGLGAVALGHRAVFAKAGCGHALGWKTQIALHEPHHRQGAGL